MHNNGQSTMGSDSVKQIQKKESSIINLQHACNTFSLDNWNLKFVNPRKRQGAIIDIYIFISLYSFAFKCKKY